VRVMGLSCLMPRTSTSGMLDEQGMRIHARVAERSTLYTRHRRGAAAAPTLQSHRLSPAPTMSRIHESGFTCPPSRRAQSGSVSCLRLRLPLAENRPVIPGCCP
jgi:hypothetical protein